MPGVGRQGFVHFPDQAYASGEASCVEAARDAPQADPNGPAVDDQPVTGIEEEAARPSSS